MLELPLLKNFTVLLVISKNKNILYNELKLCNTSNIILCYSEIDAYNQFKENIVDMIFIDCSMSNLDSYVLCSKIRKINKNIPITLISERSKINKTLNIIPLKVTCYLIKPISSQQVIETLHIMLKELNENNLLDRKRYFSNFSYNYVLKKVINIKSNVEIPLTKSELILLELFLDNMNKIITCTMIHNAFKEVKSEQAIKNMIYRLRLKLNNDVIKNFHGIGYFLR